MWLQLLRRASSTTQAPRSECFPVPTKEYICGSSSSSKCSNRRNGDSAASRSERHACCVATTIVCGVCPLHAPHLFPLCVHQPLSDGVEITKLCDAGNTHGADGHAHGRGAAVWILKQDISACVAMRQVERAGQETKEGLAGPCLAQHWIRIYQRMACTMSSGMWTPHASNTTQHRNACACSCKCA